MTFDKILEDGRLFAVRYDGDDDNILYKLFDQWNDVIFLKKFFEKNLSNLGYFKVKSVDRAVDDTIGDSEYLEEVLLDIEASSDLDTIFKPLGDIENACSILKQNKAKGLGSNMHKSWLRVYAIKLESGVYIITGGAIKLTKYMPMIEKENLEKCRNFLLGINVFDKCSFNEFFLEN